MITPFIKREGQTWALPREFLDCAEGTSVYCSVFLIFILSIHTNTIFYEFVIITGKDKKTGEKKASIAKQILEDKKARKPVSENINSRLALVMKSGKYQFGYNQTLKLLRNGKAKLVIMANNTPPLRKSELEYYAMMANIVLHCFNGNNIDLGTACGKYFRVGCLAITDPGDSDIIKIKTDQASE